MNKIIKSTAVAAAAVVAATGLAQVASATAPASTTTIRQADLIGGLSDTRSSGHVTFLTDGLHVMTDDATSQAKAAEYFSVTGALPSTASLTWFGTQPQPGQQIVFDYDGITGNGNDYNILVGEPVYGANWWLTGGSSADAKAADPSGANDGGNGSAWFGTLAEWKTAMPAARILAGGFSLGSGVKGDGVLESITYDSNEYRFTSAAAAPVPTVVNVTGKSKATVGASSLRFDLSSKAQPANSVLGTKLAWKVVVDGKTVFTTKQGFGDLDTVVANFAKHSGNHVVDLYKNGVKGRHIIVHVS